MDETVLIAILSARLNESYILNVTFQVPVVKYHTELKIDG